jgi:hypothetical protein
MARPTNRARLDRLLRDFGIKRGYQDPCIGIEVEKVRSTLGRHADSTILDTLVEGETVLHYHFGPTPWLCLPTVSED